MRIIVKEKYLSVYKTRYFDFLNFMTTASGVVGRCSLIGDVDNRIEDYAL